MDEDNDGSMTKGGSKDSKLKLQGNLTSISLTLLFPYVEKKEGEEETLTLLYSQALVNAPREGEDDNFPPSYTSIAHLTYPHLIHYSQ